MHSVMDILTSIIEKRKKDISSLGLNFGIEVPDSRKRPLHPFLKTKGVILEVKRASPSKGDISPDLDSYETACSYAKARACAISCLTEKNYFKGSLEDLMKVCKAVDDTDSSENAPAVLRKDFLLYPEEIEISYRAGADAVLLIARILTKEVFMKMAEEVVRLGMHALIEVRTDEDLEKLRYIASKIKTDSFICGVNSRDLTNFKIDLLRPCMIFHKIQKILGDDVRIIFESGVTNFECAASVSAMGFTGLLLGEAAAKNPELRKGLVDSFMNATPSQNSDFWKNNYCKIPGKKFPLIKICGLTQLEDVLLADKLEVSFLGFIFADAYPRSVNHDGRIEKILPILNKLHAKKVAVIVDLDSPEAQKAIQLVKTGSFDLLQFHKIPYKQVSKDLLALPHYFVTGSLEEYENLIAKGESRVLFDSKEITKSNSPATFITTYDIEWLAGGITPENISTVIENYHPELIDLSSGVEDDIPGIKNSEKLVKLMKLVQHDMGDK